MKTPKKIMNEEIKKYPIFVLNPFGKLIQTHSIQSTADYDHSQFHLHHFVEYQEYEKDKSWYIERGIEQKLILMKIKTHEQLHFIAVENLSDEDFKTKYHIPRWDLIFNRKHRKEV
jgi:hypothetical protein